MVKSRNKTFCRSLHGHWIRASEKTVSDKRDVIKNVIVLWLHNPSLPHPCDFIDAPGQGWKTRRIIVMSKRISVDEAYVSWYHHHVGGCHVPGLKDGPVPVGSAVSVSLEFLRIQYAISTMFNGFQSLYLLLVSLIWKWQLDWITQEAEDSWCFEIKTAACNEDQDRAFALDTNDSINQ